LDPDAPLLANAPAVIGGNNVFIIDAPPIIVNATKTANATGCKEFKLNILEVLNLNGQACLTPPSIKFCTSTSFGYDFGCVKGDPSQGVTLNINLFLVKGNIKLFLNDACVWATVDISFIFGSTYSDT
ncbi:13978_t:CDS:1, partial [Gigaspora rosea]